MSAETLEPQPAAPQPRACLVTLGGQLYAVEVRYAREVVVFDEYTDVPLAPQYLLGLANLRGRIVPLVDIRPLLGLEPSRATRRAKALVVERGATPAALLIDEVVGLEPLENLAPADGEGSGFGQGRLEREGGAATLLDVSRILAALAGAEN